MDSLYNAERRSTLVYWPTAVDERLDLLHHLLSREGYQTSRAQILAALVAATPLNGEQLVQKLTSYRRTEEGPFVAETASHSHHRRERRPGPLQ
jgi:hypothetical protein